jgi:hypothetical protein
MRHWLAGLLMCLPSAALAGAWTQDEGKWQVIAGTVLSAADRSFGAAAPIRFRRALLTTDTEYGVLPQVTLFAATETATVEVQQGTAPPFHAIDNAVEGGARLRFGEWLGLESLGVWSAEVSLRTAGAFNFAVSADRSTGGAGGQVRLLYGRGFKLWERDAFVGLELGRRLLGGPRPDETPFDLTAGLWLDRDSMVMAQSFNLFAGAGPIAAYPVFRSHKLQLSWVRRLSDRFLLQSAAFFSPAGRNALVEQGLCLSVWSRF